VLQRPQDAAVPKVRELSPAIDATVGVDRRWTRPFTVSDFLSSNKID
jgi:hypothetical protein